MRRVAAQDNVPDIRLESPVVKISSDDVICMRPVNASVNKTKDDTMQGYLII